MAIQITAYPRNPGPEGGGGGGVDSTTLLIKTYFCVLDNFPLSHPCCIFEGEAY